MSGRQLSARLSSALSAEGTFHVTSSERSGGARFTYDIQFAGNGGEGTFTSQSAGMQLHLLSIGPDLFVSASDAQWRRSFRYASNEASKLAVISGKYVQVRTNASNLGAAGMADLASWANRATLINMLFGPNAIGGSTFTDRGITTVDGKSVTRYDAPGSGATPGFELDVAATGPPLPIRITTQPKATLAATMDFTNYGEPAVISRPPASQIVQESAIYPPAAP